MWDHNIKRTQRPKNEITCYFLTTHAVDIICLDDNRKPYPLIHKRTYSNNDYDQTKGFSPIPDFKCVKKKKSVLRLSI